ncbi:hypothetical protein RclHR1_00740014 [Rhizophagus clarus]|uniref:Uncharacterized protein n=1 Tax=Rhizophagus clarus TaxID=94130 RepID=A0A2Z6RYJ3_9GLOM|nr:hypothetical protein RclHR1_00740014 [Rhizophagus clarus]
MSETSTPYTPASTSTSVAGNETVSDKALEILETQEVNGRAFLKLTKLTEEKLLCHPYNLPGGPASNFAKSGTDKIPLFSLQTCEIKDSDKHFEHCVENILFRKHYGSLVVDSLESMRNEYVSTILHTALHIVGDVTNKEFTMRPEYEIIGEESYGRVDYAIKEAENLLCITEDKVQRNLLEGFAQNIKQLESSYETNKKKRKRVDYDDFDYLYGGISQASELPVAIEFNNRALDKSSNAYKSLRSAVKEVLQIIIGLIKDRVCAEDDSPSKKKARIEGYRSKK